eukprot:scaffold1140_cov157-Amphora_coffeaeformis.AAC.7
MVQILHGPTAFPTATAATSSLSVLSYNVLLPASWWAYKMYNPPVADPSMASWDYRRDLIQERIRTVVWFSHCNRQHIDPTIVCLQEVSPSTFEEDFGFMHDLGFDSELFKKGRFRPATFWKRDQCELVAPAVHKDRTLLTAFRLLSNNDGTTDEGSDKRMKKNWYVLNCHLQAGKQAPRRVRQINEGVRAVLTLARKLKGTKDTNNLVRQDD